MEQDTDGKTTNKISYFLILSLTKIIPPNTKTTIPNLLIIKSELLEITAPDLHH